MPHDLVINTSQNAYRLIGKTQLPTSGTFERELAYAAYTGLSSVLLPEISESDVEDYARMLLAQLGSHSNVLVRVRAEADGAWTLWNRVRMLCNHDPRLQVALELSSGPLDMRQWIAEPVQLVMLPTCMFIGNKTGYPVLRKEHQDAVKRWMQLNVAFVVSHVGSAEISREVFYRSTSDFATYVRHLWGTLETQDEYAMASDAYHDVLQAPLQPLMDHLESVTYEVFEQDTPKYAQYEEAVYQALVDRQQWGREIVVAVVGAGRGPLVTRALAAAKRSSVAVKVFAVEKNPSALTELQRKNAKVWGNAVTVVFGDMRTQATGVAADILVSELLGSFGDNELSPECLDGAQRLLAEDGISIPAQYTAFVAPLSSCTLYNKAKAYEDTQMETPFVVNFNAASVLAAPKMAWSFGHPVGEISASNKHNDRKCQAKFCISQDSVIHGLAGYFEATLYGNVSLSIRPATHTPGMHSWFPMYFPIKKPVQIRAGECVSVSMWRRSGNSRVWYEWAVVADGMSSGIHNINGHEYWIGQ
ncbi:Skb1 methyltransferase [Linderina pennispora]|uniref:Protein arginine N-methyltransferase n=1 Tax=Linderina pennispora TaxID=61395 RepID=A0A1Y1WIS0_9FUNG|nr:Skb1 methyltransferase [Linderina pennispora]ORX73116.1 Skb1 methyltransferase [Linderina pennispora]